jgi:hypothetical protein
MGTEDGKIARRRVVGFLVRCVFLRPFFTIKNRLFRNPKGTQYSRHCLFELPKILD